MERSLVLIALAIGCACWLVALALTRTKRLGFRSLQEALPFGYLFAAIAVPAALFVATLPSHGPLFSPGHDLGNGFLFGAIGALLSSTLLTQNMLAAKGERSHLRTAAVVAVPFGLGASATAAALLIKHDTLSICLLAVAIGWLCTVGILLAGLLHGPCAKSALRQEPITMLAGAGYTAALCAATALGDFHGEIRLIGSSGSASWGVLALAAAATAPLFLLLSAIGDMVFNAAAGSRTPAKGAAVSAGGAAVRAYAARSIIAVSGVVCSVRILAHKVVDFGYEAPVHPGAISRIADLLVGQSRLSHVVGIGILVGLLVWWISASVQKREMNNVVGSAWQNSALTILIVLSGAMAAFQILAGFGVGLMVTGIWPAVGLALIQAGSDAPMDDSDKPSTGNTETALRVVQLAAMAGILVLFRFYTTMYEGDFSKTAYTDQYAVFGLVAGLALPLFLTTYLFPSVTVERDNAARTLIRLLISGALVLAIPSIILLLWGQKCVMALITALAISAAAVSLSPTSGGECIGTMSRKLFLVVYAFAVSLALCEWSHYILDAEDWTRIQKERVLAQVVGVVIALVLVADYAPLIAGWIRRDTVAAGTGTKGAAK